MAMEMENIPAFSMWKMLNETVPVLTKGDCSETSVKKLATIIQSKESSSIFIYYKEPSTTFEEYRDIGDKYKAFTTWLLGQCFYLLGCEKLLNLHNIIREAQLYVLDQLSKTQLHVYHELSQEYIKAFFELINYFKYQTNTTLKVFEPNEFHDLKAKLDLSQVFIEITSIPKCTVLLKNLMKIVRYILLENFTFYSFDANTYKILDGLLFLLANADNDLKIDVIELFIDILTGTKHDVEKYNLEIKRKFSEFSSLFEQIVYKIYDADIILKNNSLYKFEKLLETYLQLDSSKNYIERINEYILRKNLNKVEKGLLPSDSILNASIKNAINLSFEALLEIINILDFSKPSLIFCFRYKIYKDVIDYEGAPSEIKVFDSNISPLWSQIDKKITEIIAENVCEKNCTLQDCLNFFKKLTNMLMIIRLKILKQVDNSVCLNFFEEKKFLFLFIRNVINHFNKCNNSTIPIENILHIFVPFTLIMNSKNLEIIFSFLCFRLIKSNYYNNENRFKDSFIDDTSGDVKATIRQFYNYLSKYDLATNTSLQLLKQFLESISSNLITVNSSQLENIKICYIKMCKTMIETEEEQIMSTIIDTIPHALMLFEEPDIIITDIWNRILSSQNKKILERAMLVLSTILCSVYSETIKVLEWNSEQNNLQSYLLCKKCIFKDRHKQFDDKVINYEFGTNLPRIYFAKIRVNRTIGSSMLKQVLSVMSQGPSELKISALDTLPSFSNHILQFNSVSVTKIWLELAGDDCKQVRKKFSQIIGTTVRNSQENPLLSQETKTEILNTIFTFLLELTKKSLKFSLFDLQYSILTIIEEIISIKSEEISLQIMRILFYLIMVPTSKHSLIAINKCCNLAKTNNMNTMMIYNQNKKEFCEVIAHLCCVNQALINYSLSTSLEKVSLMFGFYGSNDFVIQECNYLLPFFISKINKMPDVTSLIDEMAAMMELSVSEMLTCKYGYVFIHIFLEMPKEEFKSCLNYLEKSTEMRGPTLRKRNFRIILNELLLNFHEKRDRVTLTLKLLADEETENKASSIPDYLQSHFLGVLSNFDVKLISKNVKKSKFLLSLADLLRYMGPKHIMPRRIKILAMLQTINYENFPDLGHEVWDAFIHTCGIETLGQKLAAIVASILPLLEHCPREINNILKYLIVENENFMKDYIADLFFVNHPKVDYEILVVIRKYLKMLEKCTLKEKIQQYLKLLQNESQEIRIQALKQLKSILEQSREELDKMILDYNGIDVTIVELINVLTLGCREKDETLKLACGKVIGELGAVEPSHLPRKYTHDRSSFSFYISEDGFIVSCLNEFLKAFNSDKNTQNVDRYSLAIQEILKEYEISPDPSMNKYYLWTELPESLKEDIKPLLYSRYRIVQNTMTYNLPVPIYGSNSGASFHSWLYSWTCSLIESLPKRQQDHLNVCLPSMKQNNRILMHYLPYILLHALIEGTDNIAVKCLEEIQTILNSFRSPKTLDHKAINLRSIPILGSTVDFPAVTPEELKQMQCTKVVFLLLDFLDQWLREWQWQKSLEQGVSPEHFQTVKDFLDKLDKHHLAKCNYQCGEYPRALMYLEDYISENNGEMSGHLSFLAEIYAQLDEPDGVDGVTTLQQDEPSVEQRILALEVSGKLADATTCYEQMLQPLKLHHIQGLAQCYLDLDNVNTALNFVKGALDQQPEFGNMLLELQAEPLWRLGQYDELESLLTKQELTRNKSWGVQVGKALVSFKKNDRDTFQGILNELLREQVESFGAASLEEGAYQHGYGYISKLHSLAELQQVEKMVNELLMKPNDKQFGENLIKKLFNEWSLRLKVVQESVRIIEPILCLRRVSLNLVKKIAEEKIRGVVPILNSLIGEYWLLSAKTARAAGMHQQAYTYTVKAEEYAPPTLFLEKAKLHWLREEHEQALMTLRRGYELILPDKTSPNELSINRRKMCAEARLLIATYNEEISNVDADMNLQHYMRAFDVYKEWEKSIVCVAQYYDKIFQTYSAEERDSKGSEMQVKMINYFGKSLQYGSNYVYQSMPRLLSIWFDYGTRLLDVKDASTKEERRIILLQMTKLIDSFLERLPTYVFLTAFSQIVSRICHPQREVYAELKCIIIKLIQQYPQQTLWMIISVIKSSYTVRLKRCAEILCDTRLRTMTPLMKLVKDFTSLAEKLIELCNKELTIDAPVASVSNLVRALPRLITKDDFSEIMVPTYKFRKLILPNPDFTSSQHNPFPNHYVHIVGIEDKITILNSLQKPRKIQLRGSDGKGYYYMLKPKDDLRKDFRLMEFNDIVNQLLSRDGDARQRRLNIRLYSVAPLNEECGLIEWIDNLDTLRNVILSIYKQKGLGMKPREIKEICNTRDTLDKKRDVFKKRLLVKHPPVLSEWFRKTFPDAQSWLTARMAYIRTTAVMSIAGYILGLGDRHGENILLDPSCGDVIHVDFNCLFNKGEKFDCPERVPFRLTHNMVTAMGPLGVEGIFRKSCACTLRVLRINTDTLMSVVTPFVYDPLVSWPKNIPSLPSSLNAERTNEEAVDHVKNIELRLQGRVKNRHRNLLKPLSVEGQTNYLISESISLDNLCQMYIGWGPYL